MADDKREALAVFKALMIAVPLSLVLWFVILCLIAVVIGVLFP